MLPSVLPLAIVQILCRPPSDIPRGVPSNTSSVQINPSPPSISSSIQGSTLFDFFVAWPWYHPWHTMAFPQHPMAWHRIPWRRGGGRGMLWVVPWQPPRQPQRHSMAISRSVMATPTVPQRPRHLGLGLGLRGMPWKFLEGSVVCRGRCRGRVWRSWCHGMPRHVAKNGNNVQALLSHTCHETRERFPSSEHRRLNALGYALRASVFANRGIGGGFCRILPSSACYGL